MRVPALRGGSKRRSAVVPPHAQSALDVVRAATRADHDATEALFADFLKAPAQHLDDFLVIHLRAFLAFDAARAGAELPEENGCLGDLIARLRADCAARALMVGDVPSLPALPSEAVAYLVIGSRLGTEVIRRKLLETGCADSLPRYFEPRDIGPAWQALRARLGAMAGDDPRAVAIASGARAGFAAFAAAGNPTQEQPEAKEV